MRRAFFDALTKKRGGKPEPLHETIAVLSYEVGKMLEQAMYLHWKGDDAATTNKIAAVVIAERIKTGRRSFTVISRYTNMLMISAYAHDTADASVGVKMPP